MKKKIWHLLKNGTLNGSESHTDPIPNDKSMGNLIPLRESAYFAPACMLFIDSKKTINTTRGDNIDVQGILPHLFKFKKKLQTGWAIVSSSKNIFLLTIDKGNLKKHPFL